MKSGRHSVRASVLGYATNYLVLQAKAGPKPKPKKIVMKKVNGWYEMSGKISEEKVKQWQKMLREAAKSDPLNEYSYSEHARVPATKTTKHNLEVANGAPNKKFNGGWVKGWDS